jgi:hypothetical protein
MNNVYNNGVSVPPSTPTVVSSVVVPLTRAPYSFKGLIIDSDVDFTFEIKKNVDTIGHGRNGAGVLMVHYDISESPIELMQEDQIMILVTQEDDVAHLIYCTLLVEQL